MKSFIFEYDTLFTTSITFRLDADSESEAKKKFWELVPGCVEIRKISLED